MGLNKITVAEIDYNPQCLDAIVAKFQFTHMTSRFLTDIFSCDLPKTLADGEKCLFF